MFECVYIHKCALSACTKEIFGVCANNLSKHGCSDEGLQIIYVHMCVHKLYMLADIRTKGA